MRSLVFHPDPGRVALGMVHQRLTGRLPLFRAGPVALESFAPKPLPGPGWVRVRVRLAGICGSDLNLLRLKFSTRSASLAAKRSIRQPFCLGHEVVGEVIETGPAVQSLQPGKRVVLVPGVCCASIERTQLCPMCLQGLPLLCLHRDASSLPLDAGAGWSDELVRPESRLFPVPDELPDDVAVLVEPLACSVHAVLRRPPVAGDSVVVIGCGVIGLGMILALRALGRPLRIVAIARHSSQAVRARAAGADTVLEGPVSDLYERLATELATQVLSRGARNQLLQWGPAVTYDAVGSDESVGHALRWTRPRGAVVVEGITPRPAPLDCTVLWLREVDLLGSHGHGREAFEGRSVHTFQLVLDWLRQGRLATDGWVTHRFPLAAFREALRAADDKAGSGAAKVALEFNLKNPG